MNKDRYQVHSLTKEGRTVIVATHSADIAARADMVLEMIDGKVTVGSVFEGMET
jgi:ABC-type lipoprotein export system ATPase subunit